MLVCNYCGRNFKNEFNTCPGCGSTTFNRVSDFGEKVIKKPPEGGYVINVDNFEKSKKIANIVKWIGWGLLIFMITFDLPFLLGGILAGQEDLLFGLTFSITSLAVNVGERRVKKLQANNFVWRYGTVTRMQRGGRYRTAKSEVDGQTVPYIFGVSEGDTVIVIGFDTAQNSKTLATFYATVIK